MSTKPRSVSILVIFIFLLAACLRPEMEAVDHTANVKSPAATMPFTPTIPPFTGTPIPAKSDGEEVTILLRPRSAPAQLRLVGLDAACLLGKGSCSEDLISIFPANVRQVQKIDWTKDGKRAVFWSQESENIYALDTASGDINLLKANISKVRPAFYLSPDGSRFIFEVGTSSRESDIVSMNADSGEMEPFHISLACMKFVSAWLTTHSFLFWCETYSGSKARLEKINVYTYDLYKQTVQSFEIGRDWMKTSIPVFSPDGQAMAFSAAGMTIIRNSSTTREQVLDIAPESMLWSTDSTRLAIYTQNKDIFVADVDGQNLTKVYALPDSQILTDWLWLPGNEDMFLVTSDENGNTSMDILSPRNHAVTPSELPVLDTYVVVSLSDRPARK